MHTSISDPESGEVICSNCGLVIAEKDLDLASPERRAFTTEESNQKARTGSPTSLSRHDRGLATIRMFFLLEMRSTPLQRFMNLLLDL